MKDETLGQVFKRYRETDKISIEKVEKDTHISKRMLLALESDDYKILPDDLYTKNIIKTYAQYLSLDYNKLLTLYKTNREKSAVNPGPIFKSEKVKVYLTPQRTRNILILLIIAALFIYLGFQFKKIFEPPQLTLVQPAEDSITNQSFIEIKGETEKEARIFINEKEVFLDSQGDFTAALDLQKGLNIIKISAVKKFGAQSTIYRKILVQ